MKQRADITVSQNAVRQGRACGLYGDTEARVRGLAASAVLAQHPAGNLTYGPYVIHMSGTHVMSITMVGPRPVDERSVSECKLCGGRMVLRHNTTIEGVEGIAYRPCPRAFDPTQPLCDTKRSTTNV